MNSKHIEKYALRINQYLDTQLDGRPAQLYKAASYLIIHGGKRLRPYMVMKSCQILGGNVTLALPAASAIEMIHNFTLVHDDIMDNDEKRHGVPTVHKKFGMPLSILAGDVLFSKAFQVISKNSKLSDKSTTELVARLSQACVDVCEGQLLDISMAENKTIPKKVQYIKMIEKKTAALFDVSCAMGAICAEANSKDVSKLSAFGKNLGISFQITDDLIGIVGDSKITKKPVGNDLREGKKSLPILHALNKAKGIEKKKILKVFGNNKASKSQISSALKIIRSMGIESETRKEAQRYAEKARKSLDGYSGQAKNELLSLLDFVIKRSL